MSMQELEKEGRPSTGILAALQKTHRGTPDLFKSKKPLFAKRQIVDKEATFGKTPSKKMLRVENKPKILNEDLNFDQRTSGQDDFIPQ